MQLLHSSVDWQGCINNANVIRNKICMRLWLMKFASRYLIGSSSLYYPVVTDGIVDMWIQMCL